MSDATTREMALEESIGKQRAELDALRTIAAQLAEALKAVVGNEINADHPWPHAALEAWEAYQR